MKKKRKKSKKTINPFIYKFIKKGLRPLKPRLSAQQALAGA